MRIIKNRNVIVSIQRRQRRKIERGREWVCVWMKGMKKSNCETKNEMIIYIDESRYWLTSWLWLSHNSGENKNKKYIFHTYSDDNNINGIKNPKVQLHRLLCLLRLMTDESVCGRVYVWDDTFSHWFGLIWIHLHVVIFINKTENQPKITFCISMGFVLWSMYVLVISCQINCKQIKKRNW